MIVAPQPRAVDVGAQVLARGGNAVDAAVTAAWAQCVLDPQNCGIGGFGSALIYWAATDTTEVVSFHARAGQRATADMWQSLLLEEYRDGYGYYIRDWLNDVGYQSIATPGTPLGLHTLHQRWGTLPWADTLAPAIQFAREGFVLSARAAGRWTRPQLPLRPHQMMRATHTPGVRAIFTRDQVHPWGEGQRLVQSDYAATLERVAQHGPPEFYHGATAYAMSDDMARNGGLFTAADLAGYRIRTPEPVVGTYRGYTIVSDPPPSGGMTLIQLLNLMEGYDVGAMQVNSPDYIDLVARAMQWAYRDWALFLGDPEYAEIPVARLTDKAYAAAGRAALDRGERFTVPRWRADEQGTTHVSVVDNAGNAVAMTHSLGASSGVVTTGLGFQYNNCMNCFDPIPGHVNSIAPGKARISGLAPTLVFKDGALVYNLGAPGGTRITTGVFQTLLNLLDFGMSPVEAVSLPRFDSQSHVIDVEARFSDAVCDELRRRGHAVERTVAAYWSAPQVHVIERNPTNGKLRGGADPRADGMALEVS